MNGKRISNAGIVIKPGSRIYLERYLDTPQKFLFETYKVEDSEASKFATRNNGLITVSFYDEDVPVYEPPVTITYTTNACNSYNTFDVNQYKSNYLNHRSTDTVGATLSTGPKFRSSSFAGGASASMDWMSQEPEIETGRIEKGSHSHQSFAKYNGKFKKYVTNTIRFKLLPLSAKPLEVNDLATYCVECGSRNKAGKYKYCPVCGNKY